jgi:arginase
LLKALKCNDVEVIQCPQHPDRAEYQVDAGVLKRPLAVSYNTQHLYQSVLRAMPLSKSSFKPPPKIINLGGDHSIAMGSVAGMARQYPDLAVIWIDAHADINTPKSTVSGNLHGCPVAFLLQLPDCLAVRGFEWMESEARKVTPASTSFLTPDRIGYLGLRDVEPQEQETMQKLNIAAAYMSDIARCPDGIAGCLKKILKRIDPEGTRPLFVSFDIDGIDPRWAPSTGTPVERGISLEEAMLVCRKLRKTGRLVGMDLVEVNPDLGSADDQRLTVSTALKVITSLFGN